MLYTLKNKNYTLIINSLGAELKSSKYKNEEYLHIGDDNYWSKSSPVLFPIVGKLKNNKYTYEEKTYSLDAHGFARHNEFELINESEKKLVFLLKENEETLKVYPFVFNLQITYTLKDEGFTISYEVSSKEEILFSLGAHPAFLLKDDLNNSYLEFEEIEKKDLLGLDLENGCIAYSKKEYLNSKILKLEKNIFKDDALIFENLKSKTISLKNRNNSKSVRVSYDCFTHMGFWAPVGAPFVCIEPWCGLADDISTSSRFENKKAIVKLKKDELFKREIFLSFT